MTMQALLGRPDTAREQEVLGLLTRQVSDLLAAAPLAFEAKFRKMASSPFAFYRGSAHLFHHDLASLDDPWATGPLARTWIHGDLHAENYGTYMSATGRLHFDVNDFDESCLGPFTSDLRRMVVSLDLLGYQKAMSDDQIDQMVRTFWRSYLSQVTAFTVDQRAHEFAVTLDVARGHVATVLQQSRQRTRIGLLEQLTVVEDGTRRFATAAGAFPVGDDVRTAVLGAFDRYLDTIPPGRRPTGGSARVKDVVGRRGVGIGSAGLPSYNLLLEGHTEALENDVVLFMKQARPAAPMLGRAREESGSFQDDAERTVLAQRGLQADTDPWLGHTVLDGRPMLVAEVSPYASDICWDDVNDEVDVMDVLDQLGRATAKMHCVSDRDSDDSLVPFSVDQEIRARMRGREQDFEADLVAFARGYADVVRRDHRIFHEAYRNRRIQVPTTG